MGSRAAGPRRAVALAIAVGACGRYGFSARDASDAGVQPQFEVYATGQNADEAAVSFAVSVPADTPRNLYLLVAVAIGGHCVLTGDSPAVSGLALGSAELTPIAAITGSSCNATQTRSELWGLVAPPVGVADVAVQLDGTPITLVAAAVLFSGIDPASPVRATATMSGGTDSSTVAVASELGDLVVDFVGQGTAITAPSDGATELFVDNISGSDTLDNLAASATASVGSSVVMAWTFPGSDVWQTIAASLEP